jgi:hypothetical protein
MQKQSGGKGRRGLLKQGMFVVAGALGLATVDRTAVHAATASPTSTSSGPKTTSLKLYGRGLWSGTTAGRPGEVPLVGDQISARGELLQSPAGEKAGEFHGTGFCVSSPFSPGAHAAANMEFHTFLLSDGSLIGMGSTAGGNEVFAIVGGTGRYHGASGSYTARQSPLGFGGGTAEFEFMLTL